MPLNLETIAEVRVQLNADGSIQISGHLGDKALALRLLDHAKDAIREQVRDPSEVMVIPNYDVSTPAPKFAEKAYGDFAPTDLGDLAKCQT